MQALLLQAAGSSAVAPPVSPPLDLPPLTTKAASTRCSLLEKQSASMSLRTALPLAMAAGQRVHRPPLPSAPRRVPPPAAGGGGGGAPLPPPVAPPLAGAPDTPVLVTWELQGLQKRRSASPHRVEQTWECRSGCLAIAPRPRNAQEVIRGAGSTAGSPAGAVWKGGQAPQASHRS